MFLVSWPGGSWEATVRGIVVVLALYVAALWITLIFWTYRDIRQRTRDPIVQSVSVLLVLFFFVPGLWLYLILRPRNTLAELYERSLEEEALLQELEDQKSCPSCKRRVQDEYLICPSCRAQLKEPCRQCSRPLHYAWIACPFCGHEKPPREAPRPRTRPMPTGRTESRTERRPTVVASAAPARPQERSGQRPPAATEERREPRAPVATEERPEPARTPTRPDPFAVRSSDDGQMIDATAAD
jgi:RNA polymerase subunit RPABC4/transcription elongation factor Spt4